MPSVNIFRDLECKNFASTEPRAGRRCPSARPKIETLTAVYGHAALTPGRSHGTIEIAWSFVVFPLAIPASASRLLWSTAPAQLTCRGGVAGFASMFERVTASSGRGTSWPGIIWPPCGVARLSSASVGRSARPARAEASECSPQRFKLSDAEAGSAFAAGRARRMKNRYKCDIPVGRIGGGWSTSWCPVSRPRTGAHGRAGIESPCVPPLRWCLGDN